MQGKTINGFTLQRLLGVGGMAEVWYAESNIGMKAAVKIINEKLSHDDQMQERFLNEAKVMVMLDHPNIRKVYGFDQIDGRPAIIMEYLDGSDLKARMKSGQRFRQEELVKWWNQLVDALNYTHAQNIVHRDIKPSNIFVDQHGNVKLLDFGIAKVAETTTGTQTGSTLGTRIYMSPEQVRDSKRVGPPSDVYSLAVSFVHLLTGKAPYDSTTDSDYDIQESIVRKPLDLSKVPEAWRGFLAPYLEKKPDQRPVLKQYEVRAYTPSAFQKPQNPMSDADEKTITDSGRTTPAGTQPKHNISPANRQSGRPPLSSTPKNTPKKKGKKGLWIGLGVAAAVLIALVVSKPTTVESNSQPVLIGYYNGHEYVDLGLPSGTLWATCNLGATKPEDYGDFYAWGETQTKSVYSWASYRYTRGTSWLDARLTKYCNNSEYGYNGFTDGLTILQSDNDAATVHWGTGWSIPSDEQWQELLDNTDNHWTTQNGIKGRVFVAKNGETLFLPAAGYWYPDRDFVQIVGSFWSRSIDTPPSMAKHFGFDWQDVNNGRVSGIGRSAGLNIRAVCKK